jgi:hypothetical protein
MRNFCLPTRCGQTLRPPIWMLRWQNSTVGNDGRRCASGHHRFTDKQYAVKMIARGSRPLNVNLREVIRSSVELVVTNALVLKGSIFDDKPTCHY